MFWVCNYSPKTFAIGDITLLPYTCAGLSYDDIEDSTIAAALASGELCVHSSYFEGQQSPDACPAFAALDEALLHAAAAQLGVQRRYIHPVIEFTIKDHVAAGLLTGFDGLPEVLAKAKQEADEQDARKKRESGESVEPAPAPTTTKRTKAS
jgi:hypothetical protein